MSSLSSTSAHSSSTNSATLLDSLENDLLNDNAKNYHGEMSDLEIAFQKLNASLCSLN